MSALHRPTARGQIRCNQSLLPDIPGWGILGSDGEITMIQLRHLVLSFAFLVVVSASEARATFHFMQIEQVIGGVSGDTTLQAIQLRMRSSFQNIVSESRIRAWDAAGANPVMIIDIGQDVANFQGGDRVLIVSANMANATSPAVAGDFVMTNLIPADYLAAGSLTFESDTGLIYWRLSWGGPGYTGATTGQTDNDNDPGSPANFGPPFAGPLPSTTLQALRFTGAANALSTSNSADYALTTGAAVLTNNARNSFTVIAPEVVGDIDADSDVDLADFALCMACLTGPDGERTAECPADDFTACDLREDGSVDLLDAAEFAVLDFTP